MMSNPEREAFFAVATAIREASTALISGRPAEVVAQLEAAAAKARGWLLTVELERARERHRPSRRNLRGLHQLARSR